MARPRHTVDRGETSIPPELDPAIEQLGRIIAAHRPPGRVIGPGS